MRIFFTGATGLIGQRLVLRRLEQGDRVVILSRDAGRAARLFAADVNPNVEILMGDPRRPGGWQGAVNSCDAVIHLAGASIAGKRWTEAYKRELIDSRIESTRRLVEAIHHAPNPPRCLLSASAIGYYGETGEKPVDELAPAGDDFLAQLCRDWEEEADRARETGTRVVTLRIGLLLDDRGGALQRMLTPFRLGLGGPIGLGRAYWSWIHHQDMLGLVDLALETAELDGPFNLTAPNPVTQRTFARALGRALRRPAWMMTPPFMLRVVLGELATYVRMSQRILPTRAQQLGYTFLYPRIDEAFASLFRRAAAPPPRSAELSSQRAAPISTPAPAGASNHVAAQADSTGAPRPAARIRLIAVDVDGTLLRSDGTLTRGVADAIRAARQAGCLIIPASARPPRSTHALVHLLGLDGPTINYNGAAIWNPIQRQPLFHQPLDTPLALEMIAAAREVLPSVIIAVERLDQWFTDRLDAALPASAQPDRVAPFADLLDEPITKIDFHAPPHELSAVADMLRTHYWSDRRIALFPTEAGLVQVMHPLVDKGIALQRIARQHAIPREAVMAIGDGPNDVGMVEWAGFGVAVGNASDVLREVADACVASNDDHGVARAIHRYVLAHEPDSL